MLRFTSILLAALLGCTSSSGNKGLNGAGGKGDGFDELQLTDDELATIVSKAATCPFVHTAVKTRR
jgi:hypothetical protein